MDSIGGDKTLNVQGENGGFRLKGKVQEMIYYASPILVNFPKAEKYLLAARIRETMYEMLHICNVIQKKYYKKDTLNQLDVLLQDLRDYLELAASPKLYPSGTSARRRRRKAKGEAADAAPPEPVVCITAHQHEVWSRYTAAIGGMIHNYKLYVDGRAPRG